MDAEPVSINQNRILQRETKEACLVKEKRHDIWLGTEARPEQPVRPAVQHLSCGAVVPSVCGRTRPECRSPLCGLVPRSVHGEPRGELPHPSAARQGPCSARCITPEGQRVAGETGELGSLCWELTGQQAPGPGARAFWLLW